jgi:transcriptional regulator with XRE-family HTH domain
MVNYAERLRELRTEKGISQKDAARDLGVSQALLSHYEKGIREFGLDFLNRAADYYKVTTDYLLGRTDSRTGLESSFFQDREEDGIYNTTTIYRAAIFIHERMNTGSALAGDSADFLYSLALYRTLFTAAQKGYIPKRWFSLPPKIAETLPMAVTEGILQNFPDKSPNAKRYGSPEPKSIETVIRTIESYIKKAATDIVKSVD